MAIEGMDVQAVSGIHGQMTRQLAQLNGVVSAMPGLIHQLEAAWKGSDANQFAQQWPSHQSQLKGALQALQQICDHTKANLNQQQTTSGQLL